MKEYPTLTNSSEYFTKFRPGNNEILRQLGAPHIESFNYMLREGLQDCVANMLPAHFQLPNGDRCCLRVSQLSIAAPTVPHNLIGVRTKPIYPTECRQRAATYKGQCVVRVDWSVNGVAQPPIDKELGEVPIMLRSDACNLSDLKPAQLVEHGEHETEWGGYFVVKGHEKLIRMLLMTRKNYPVAVKRSTWRDRGQHFSDTGILVRSVKTDQTATNNVLHFITNGTAKLMFSHRKTLSFIPPLLVLKALTNRTDEAIYRALIAGFETDQYYLSCVQQMQREVHEENIHTQQQCKEYLGQIFRPRFYEVPAWSQPEEVTDFLLNECLLIHLADHEDKFQLLVFMVQKLFQTVQGKHKIEGADGVMMQEILLGGHLYQKVLKERVETWLQYLKVNIAKRATDTSYDLSRANMLHAMKVGSGIGAGMANFLSTGNLTSKSGLGLMQNSGLVIMAENINRMRYMSHFRAVHRGSYFVQMRTTEARQLLPDAWGFICPVHTPDGTPCGLLNHLTVNCTVSGAPDAQLVANVPRVLVALGMVPLGEERRDAGAYVVVMLEGRILGHLRAADMQRVEAQLRRLKIAGTELPQMLEIAVVQPVKQGQYPGLFLFVGPARMMRPVLNLAAGAVEYIGTFEQVYMEISVAAEEAYAGRTTHQELSKTAFMSNLANLIPMPDCNQSPRNMYQCQMGKQTMGTPCHNWQQQSETKLYRLQTPATPLFRPVHHDNIELDDFAMGTNAIVAVVSYTGYDMEDAMIINKSAYERGFAHGSIVKTEFVELRGDSFFARDPHRPELVEFIDNDGFPYAGRKLEHRQPLYCYFDTDQAVYKTVRFDHHEEYIVDGVKLCGDFALSAARKACITYRVVRNPSVGDKFASRAGQKGICSQKWPAIDLPFTESGLIPDIVFNPHGFPSRMTIAMMIETMAGKTASVHGLVHDATPFRFTEKNTAIDYFGRLLTDGGYNYYGREKLYSGVDGREMTADIFMGVVHYQRLRHMVSDKWQVRSTGPIDVLTHQPIKGRKRGGGVRFGEMERDALIAHGASFLLQDRLFHCSDRTTAQICRKCGTLLGPISGVIQYTADQKVMRAKPTCRLCKEGGDIGTVEIPYIFKFLVTQLSSVNINVKMSTTVV